MTSRHLTELEIKQMADWAVTNYEVSCSWKSAFAAAAEFAGDEFKGRATNAQAATAVNIAKTIWEGYRMQSKE